MRKHFILTICMACALCALAKPARKGVMTVETPDGSSIEVRLVGDEFFHQYLTPDGYPLIETESGFNYCSINADGDVIDSGIKATSVAQRDVAALQFLQTVDLKTIDDRIGLRASRNRVTRAGAPPYKQGYGLFPGAQFPAYGSQKAIVILVEYQDVSFQDSYTVDAKDYFYRMLNEDGFCDKIYGGTGSAMQYFKENSQGAFIPEFDVYGPVKLSNSRAYYGANQWGNDVRPVEMIMEACELVDEFVDFKDYDRDGDGIIDNIYVFYAGQGEASGGPSSSIWPHSFSLDEAGRPKTYYDGVRLNTYACSNEWEVYRGVAYPDGIGTFVHEFSHVLGLPDLYNTASTGNPFTPDEWSALDYGPYNNDGKTPPNYGAFERYALGWIRPYSLTKSEALTLPEISENQCFIIKTDKDTEFYLLENRQQRGWDEFIPGHGMLIWHIDYQPTRWTNNTVNNNSAHQCVDIVEADDVRSSSTRHADSFPGTKGVTEFSYDTTPRLKTWSNDPIDCALSNIAESDLGIISFDVYVENEWIDPDNETNGISAVSPVKDLIIISGNIIMTSQDAEILIYDVAGRLIKQGFTSVSIDSPGLYVISVPRLGVTKKILL